MKNDLTGKRFGRLTAKFVCGKSKDRHYLWHCVCDCGNEVVVPSNGLTCGHTKSCGCLKNRIEDLTGKKFGRLTVCLLILRD